MVQFELFNGVGDEGGITVDGVRSFLNSNKGEDINFQISSLGGDLGQAISIYNLIKLHPKKTSAEIVGLTASAGTVIAMACDSISINENALFLIHNGWQNITGNIYDFQQAAANLAKTDAIMIKIYKDRTGLPELKIRELMKASDWLTPMEAKDYGFIDKIDTSQMKIAASAIITEAQNGKIDTLLLTKLKEKMKIFGKDKTVQTIMNVLALKDGAQAVINAEEAATGVEIAPLGALSLEDGEYELADGRKIIVAGGVITEVVEMAAPEGGDDTEAIVAAVGEIVANELTKIRAEFNEKFSKISSTHTPAKGTVPNASSSAPIDIPSRVKSVTDGIFNKIAESRKA